ncbi:choice-of-anchor J domain-containing protein [bacterium AH-315-C07]|nr:choice-of-anchor J domain-containing protein [bacterium AH-315-C07]
MYFKCNFKSRLFIALLVLVGYGETSSAAKDTILCEDFGAGIPAGFILNNNDGSTPAAAVSYVTDAWVIRDNPSQSGDSVLVSTSWYTPADTSDDWIITPALILTTNNRLSWNAYASDPSYRDGYEVRISTTGTSLADFYANAALFSVAAENTAWTSRYVDLGAAGYENQTVYIAFRNNSIDKFLLYLDDICVYEPFVYDANLFYISNSLDALIIPASQSTNINFSGEIANEGIDTLTNLNLQVDVLNSSSTNVYSQNDSTSLLIPDDTTTITTTSGFSSSLTDNYTTYFTVSANEADSIPGNNIDTLYFTIHDSTYARDNGNFTGSIGYNNGTGNLGNIFTIVNLDTLTSVDLYFNNPRVGDSISISVYDWTGTTTTTLLYTSSSYALTAGDSLWMNIRTGFTTLAAGVYMIVVNQLDTNNIGLGYDSNSDGLVYSAPSTTYSTFGSLMLRPNFGYGLQYCNSIINIAGTNLSCNGLTDGTTSVTVSGGFGVYTYKWNTGATTQNINNLSAGTYLVTVTNNVVCTNSGSITISEPSSLALFISLTNVSVYGGNDGAVDLSVSGGTPTFTYQWSNGATTEDISSLTGAVYYITVTDVNSCVSDSSVTITSPATLDTILCEDFDAGLPAGFTLNNNDGATPNTAVSYVNDAWVMRDNPSQSGDSILVSTSWYTPADTSDDWIITPAINLTTYNRLSWNAYTSDPNWRDGYEVRISTTGTALADFYANAALFSTTAENTTWTSRYVDLGTAGYQNQTVYIAFRNNSLDKYLLNLDDICIYQALPYDADLLTVSNSLDAMIIPYAQSTNLSFSGEVHNFGIDSLTNLNLQVNVVNSSNSGVFSGTGSASLLIPDDTTTISTTSGFSTSLTDNYTAYFSVNANEPDSNQANNIDTLYFTIHDSTYAKDNGVFSGAVGYNNNTGDFGNIFTLVNQDTLTSVDLYFNIPKVGDSISISVYVWVDTVSTTLLYTSDSYAITASDSGWMNIQTGFAPLTAGDYMIVLNQLDSNLIGIGYDSNPDGIIYYVAGWAPGFGALMLRPNFGNVLQYCNSSATTVGTDLSCFGNSDGSASVTASGGFGNYTYKWNTGDINQSIIGLVPGNYTVTVTDNIGCTTTDNISITEPSLIWSLMVDSTFVTCNGGNDGSARVSVGGGTPPYTYQWSNGTTASNISNLSSGIYSVTVLDINNCSTANDVVIYEPTFLGYSIGVTDVSCNGGNDGSASVSGTGGTTPYAYSWNTGETTQTIAALSLGLYTATVTDANGCDTIVTIPVFEPQILALGISTTNVSNFGGSDGAVDISASGGTTTYTYLWSNGATTEDISGLVSGTYYITVTDVNSCQISTSVTITEPAAPSNSSFTSFQNASIVIGQPDFKSQINVISDSTLSAPTFSAISSKGMLAVAEQYDATYTEAGCVKIWYNSPTSNGVKPDVIIGSLNFFAHSSGPSASEISYVDGVAWSPDGNKLIVASGDQNRVLIWNSIPSTNGQPADVILGQSDFITTISGLTDSSFSYPSGIYVSPRGKLLIGDIYNNRVLVWNSIPTGNRTPADVVIGQTDFYSNTADTGMGQLNGPWGIGLTPTGELLIADEFNHRILIFDSIPETNGEIATRMLGVTGVSTATDSTFTYPIGVTGLPDGTIAVGEFGNNRVLLFDTLPASNEIAHASVVLGQPDFISSSAFAGASADSNNFSEVYNVSSDLNGRLFVTGRNMHRVLVFGELPTDSADLSISITESTTLTCDSINAVYTVKIINMGTDTAKNVVATAALPVDYIVDNVNAVTGTYNQASGYWNVPYLAPYDTVTLIINGKINVNIAGQTITTYVNILSSSAVDENQNNNGTSITISKPTLLSVTINKTDVTCKAKEDGTASADVIGGTTPYTYAWSNTATIQNISGLDVGIYTITITDNNGCKTGASLNITEPSVLSAYTTNANVTCNNGNDGSAFASASGGSGSYVFVWNTGENTQSINNLIANNYQVTITDANGCKTDTNISISEPGAIILTANKTDATCGNTDGTATATASGGTGTLAYEWNTGAIIQSISNLALGAYSITVTDASGCRASASVTINDIGGPQAFISSHSDVKCIGESNGIISITVSSGIAPISYKWNSGQTSPDLTDLFAGSYLVTITDGNGCKTIIDTVVNEPPKIVINATPNDANCFGDENGTISVGVTGGTPGYTYSWNIGVITQSIGSLAEGTYIVTVTDANGCKAEKSTLVSEPDDITISTSNTDASCGNADGSAVATGSGGNGGFTYNWNTGISTQSLNNVASGSYVITVSDTKGCKTYEVVTINDFGAPTVSINNKNDISCNGAVDGSISVTVSSGTTPFTFAWNTGSNTTSISNLTSGNYLLTVKDINGCRSFISASINEPQALTVNIIGTDVSCKNVSDGEATANGSGGTGTYSFNWSTGGNSQIINNLAEGSYFVTIADANGCTTSDSVNLTFTSNKPMAGFDYSVSGLIVYFTDSSANANSLFWDFGNSTTSSGSNPVKTYSDTGNYNVCLIASNSCGSDTICTIITLDDTSTTGGSSCSMTVSPGTINLGSDPGSTTFNITTDSSWTISENCDWLSLSSTAGSGSSIITIDYNENLNSTSRSCTITISCSSESKTVVVNQAEEGSSCLLTVSPSTINVTSSSGVSNFSLTANENWTIDESCDWVSVSSTGGTGNKSISITYIDNSTTSTRLCDIIVNCGISSKTVSLIQEAPTGISSIQQLDPTIKIYPNPNRGILNIEIDKVQQSELTIRLINTVGDDLYTKSYESIPTGKHTLTLDLSHLDLSSGLYYLQIQNNKQRSLYKIGIVK